MAKKNSLMQNSAMTKKGVNIIQMLIFKRITTLVNVKSKFSENKDQIF